MTQLAMNLISQSDNSQFYILSSFSAFERGSAMYLSSLHETARNASSEIFAKVRMPGPALSFGTECVNSTHRGTKALSFLCKLAPRARNPDPRKQHAE